jgi:hypothetical protein
MTSTLMDSIRMEASKLDDESEETHRDYEKMKAA